MSDVFALFKVVLFAQLFYGVSITMVVYSLPADAIANATMFQTEANKLDVADFSSDLQSNVQGQINVPLIDVAALVFFSGNLVLDLLLNSFFAIPSMLSLALHGFFLFINIDAFLAATIKTFVMAVAAIFYFLALIAFVVNMRAQAQVVG